MNCYYNNTMQPGFHCVMRIVALVQLVSISLVGRWSYWTMKTIITQLSGSAEQTSRASLELMWRTHSTVTAWFDLTTHISLVSSHSRKTAGVSETERHYKTPNSLKTDQCCCDSAWLPHYSVLFLHLNVEVWKRGSPSGPDTNKWLLQSWIHNQQWRLRVANTRHLTVGSWCTPTVPSTRHLSLLYSRLRHKRLWVVFGVGKKTQHCWKKQRKTPKNSLGTSLLPPGANVSGLLALLCPDKPCQFCRVWRRHSCDLNQMQKSFVSSQQRDAKLGNPDTPLHSSTQSTTWHLIRTRSC